MIPNHINASDCHDVRHRNDRPDVFRNLNFIVLRKKVRRGDIKWHLARRGPPYPIMEPFFSGTKPALTVELRTKTPGCPGQMGPLTEARTEWDWSC